MVNREALRIAGLRAYEAGRLRVASRVALVVVPVAALCLVESRGRGACACLATTLVALAVWLRWRHRRGMESVSTGLLAGSLPLAAGLVLDGLGVRCGLAGGSTFCTAFAVLLGGVAGVVVGLRERRWAGRLGGWIAAAAVAALAASLGCLRLGVVGFAGVIAGIAVGAAAAVTSRRAPPSVGGGQP